MIENMEIGDKLVKVNMLQHAHDTLFFYKVNTQSVFIIKVILNWFELASGLKINFLKSKIGGVGVNHNLIQCFVAILNCDVAKTHLNICECYLGVPQKR